MLVKMTKDGQEALLQTGTEAHTAYLNAGWTNAEVVVEDTEVPAIGEPDTTAPAEPDTTAPAEPDTTAPAEPDAPVTTRRR